MSRALAAAALLLVACTDDETFEEPLVAQFGHADARSFAVLGTADDGLAVPRDLAFNPQVPGELWTVNEANDGTVIYWIDEDGRVEDAELRIDSYANHFMAHPSGLAFGGFSSPTNVYSFATCQESQNTYGGQHDPNNFMGPTLWPSDLELYAEVNQSHFGSLQGSHLDMLHSSPNCMGIGHHADNAYWVFDGHNGHLVYYDFQEDHGPGGHDHSDGIIHRYDEVELTRVPGVPGHLVLDQGTGILYVADTGTGRVLWVDTGSAERVQALPPHNEHLDDYARYSADHGVLADGFSQPSGLALHDGLLFVSDHATGEIVALTLEGDEVDRLSTPAVGLMGLEVGPDARLWYVDADSDEVVRLEPGPS